MTINKNYHNRTLWPKTKFAGKNSISDQLAHIASEIDEVDRAANTPCDTASFLAGQSIDARILPMLRELADVQASIETLWYVLDRIFGEGFSEAMVLGWVEDKNRARGYYHE